MAKPSARIVVVDDDPQLCEFMKEFLTRSGYETEYATSAPEALDILEARGAHLVLLDMMMPGMTGEELAPLIKLRSPSTPVVMISAFPPRGVSGVDQIFPKPLSLLKLKEIVKSYLADDDAPFSELTNTAPALKTPNL